MAPGAPSIVIGILDPSSVTLGAIPKASEDIQQFVMKKAKICCVLAAICIAVGLLAFKLIPLPFRLDNSQTPSEVSRRLSRYQFSPSDRVVYNIEYVTKSSFDFSLLLQGQILPGGESAGSRGYVQSQGASIRGELVVTVLEKSGESLLVSCRFDKHAVWLSVNGQPATDRAAAIRNDLGREVYVTMNPRGTIKALRFQAAVAMESAGYFQVLLAITQVVFPEGGDPDLADWMVTEEDLGGNYLANYRMQALSNDGQAPEKDGVTNTFIKTKVRYFPPVARSKGGKVQIKKTLLPEGSLKAIFDFGRGLLVSLDGNELQTVLLGRNKVGQVNNTIHLTFVTKESIGKRELSSLRKLNAETERSTVPVFLSTNLTEKEAEVADHRRQLGNATLESLLTDLGAAEAAHGKYPVSLFLNFKSLIYLHPESCKSIANVLAAADAESLTMGVLGGALVAIGHKEAQAALVSVANAKRDDLRSLLALIPALGGLAEPTKETEEILRTFAAESTHPDIRATAELALGSLAGNLIVSSPDRADRIVREFIQKLESSPAEGEIQRFLHVLGNTGSPLALATIENYLPHFSPDIRAAAVYALRWIQSGEVDILLAKGVVSDPARSVRLEAADALGVREMTTETYHAQRKSFDTDNALEVRLAVLDNLANALEDYPEIRALIRKAAAEDTAKEVRKAANNIMARYPPGHFK
jgi:hypothetical protein